MHPNSLLAYHQGRTDLFSKRQQGVLAVLAKGPATDREIMIALERTDPNAVRPRVTELLAAGVLEEAGQRTDPMTRKTVRIVKLKGDPRTPVRQFDLAIN